jgi:hypothetical protein
MSDVQQPTAEHYRDTAEEIRPAAQWTPTDAIRRELLELAERYDRMAMRVREPR